MNRSKDTEGRLLAATLSYLAGGLFGILVFTQVHGSLARFGYVGFIAVNFAAFGYYLARWRAKRAERPAGAPDAHSVTR